MCNLATNEIHGNVERFKREIIRNLLHKEIFLFSIFLVLIIVLSYYIQSVLIYRISTCLNAIPQENIMGQKPQH